MNTFYIITMGGVGDNLRQLNRFAFFSYLIGAQPNLLQLQIKRYKTFDVSLQFLSKQLYGELPVQGSFDKSISMSELLNEVAESSFGKEAGNILVEGDSSIYARANQLVNSLRAKNPDKVRLLLARSDAFVRNLLRRGTIYRHYLSRQKQLKFSSEKSIKVSVHLRLGDIALVRKGDFAGTPLENLFVTEYLSPDTGFITAQQLVNQVREKRHHLGLRFSKMPSVSTYLESLQSLRHQYEGHPIHITFCTDGYSRCAKILAGQTTDMTPGLIENKLNRVYLSPLMQIADELFIGEHKGNLLPTIQAALDANITVLGSSAFPYDLRRALGLTDPRLIQLTGGGDPLRLI